MVLSILSGTGSLHKRIPEFSSPVLILEGSSFTEEYSPSFTFLNCATIDKFKNLTRIFVQSRTLHLCTTS